MRSEKDELFQWHICIQVDPYLSSLTLSAQRESHASMYQTTLSCSLTPFIVTLTQKSTNLKFSVKIIKLPNRIGSLNTEITSEGLKLSNKLFMCGLLIRIKLI